MALAQPGAVVPKGDLILVPSHRSAQVTLASPPSLMEHPNFELAGTSGMKPLGLCCSLLLSCSTGLWCTCPQ